MDISRLRFPLRVVAIGLLLGLVGDLLFYSNSLGISAPIFTVGLLVALVGMAVVEETSIVWGNLWIAAPMVFLAAMSAVRAEPLLRFLNLSGVLLLLALQAYSLTTRPLIELNLGGYFIALLETSLAAFMAPFPLLKRSVEAMEEYGGSGRVLRRVLVGLLIAAPLLAIFTALFAAADPIFQELVGDVFSADLVGHALLTLILAWLVMGGLAYALGRVEKRGFFEAALSPSSKAGERGDQDEETVPEPASEAVPKSPTSSFNFRELWGALEASVTLFSIDALFSIFVVIQFAALFGGEAFLRRHELTYSEYARRGFFELLTVSLITLGLILVLDFITRRAKPIHNLAFLIGSGLMIALTVVILASAFQRLRLYELAYGFTRLRLYTHVFMAWLAALFVAFLAMLVTRRTRLFATGALIMALGVTATLDVLNPDALIFRRNLERYQRGEELDVDYLGQLSADVVPSLFTLLDADDAEIGESAGSWLHYHLNRLDARQAKAGWPSYHYSINRAYRLLDGRRDVIEEFEEPPNLVRSTS